MQFATKKYPTREAGYFGVLMEHLEPVVKETSPIQACCGCNQTATVYIVHLNKYYCDKHAPDIWSLVKRDFNREQILFLREWNKNHG